MNFHIKTTKAFERDFAKLDALTQTRVLTAIEKMQRMPFLDAKKLKNVNDGIWRIRIGDYRIRFDITGRDIILYRVRHRREIYR